MMRMHSSLFGATLLSIIGPSILGSAAAFGENSTASLPNLALNPHALASQSSVCNGSEPGFAIDDDATTFAETCDESNPWWMINLDGQDSSSEKNYDIVQVSIDSTVPLDAQVQILDSSLNIVASTLLTPGSGFLATASASFDHVLGRYVRIWSSNAGVLSLSRVRVHGMESMSNLFNLALSPNAVATQSTTCAWNSYPEGVASLAIDGDSDGTGGKYTYTCYNETDTEYPWWMVDLDAVMGIDQSINEITVHNRQDQYLSSLSYSFVEVLDGDMNTLFSEKLPAGSKDPSWTFRFTSPVIGRFVRVRKHHYGILAIAEVTVKGAPTQWNVARTPYAIASQSSTCASGSDTDGVASRAVDGNTGGDDGEHTFTCKVDGEYSWWMVDLDSVTNSEQAITKIIVHNRQNSYLKALSGSYVQIVDSNMNNVFMERIPAGSTAASWTFDLDYPIVGRYVRVQTATVQSLGIAEVEVIGTPAPKEPRGLLAKFPHAVATQSSTCSANDFDTPGIASRAIAGFTDGVMPHYTYSCIIDGEYQWWMVDLDPFTQIDAMISEIIIYNRQDGFLSALSYSYVEVLDGNMNTVYSQKLPTGSKAPSWNMLLDAPTVGRFVRIRKYNDGLLALAGVDVITSDAPTSTVTTTTQAAATTTSTTTTSTTVATTTTATTTTSTASTRTTRSPLCPPPFDRPEGLQPEAQAILATALETLREHMLAGPSDPLLNQTEIIAVTNDVLANSHQLTATYDLMEAALSLVEAYEGDGQGPPTSYGPPVLMGAPFSRDQGTLDGRELDRSMLMIQQDILDQMFHASLWGRDGVPSTGSSEMIDWPYKPVVNECQDLFRGRKFWAAKYIPGLVDPPVDSTVVHSELVKADFPKHWGRPVAFADQKRAIYPIGGLYLSSGGVAYVTVPQEVVDHGGYTIQIGSHSTDCGRDKKGWTRQNRMTTSFPVDELTTVVANPFGGELYIRPPYGSTIERAEVHITGDVVEGATFFYSSVRNTTEDEWDYLRQNGAAPWVHIVTDNYLRQWHAEPVKAQTYSFMVQRAKRYIDTYTAAGKVMGVPPEKRNTFVLYQAFSSNSCGRASVASMGYPQNNMALTGDENGIKPLRYEFDVQDPILGQPPCCGKEKIPHAHDPEGLEPGFNQQVDFHELGHSARWGCSGLYKGGEGESINHVPMMAARWSLEGQNDSTDIDPTGIDRAFMFSCCSEQNPHTYAPRFTIDRQAIEWMVRDNFLKRLPMEAEEIKYQHRGHAKYADIARLTGSLKYMEDFMREEHERWESEAAKGVNSTNNGGLGTGSCYWWRNFDDTFFPEFDDTSSESRTLRLSIKAGQDLTPLLHFWGVEHTEYSLLKDMMVTRGLYPSQEQKDLLLKYKSLIPQNSSVLEALHYDIWVPNITKKCSWRCEELRQRALEWNETMISQAESHLDAIIEMHWPPSSRQLNSHSEQRTHYLRRSSPPKISLSKIGEGRRLDVNTDFEENINKWIADGPDSDYQFIFERECICPEEFRGPFKVTVQNGVVTEAEYAREPSEEIVNEHIDLNEVPTIEGLFNFIAEAIETPDNLVQARYDAVTGCPVEIRVTRSDDDNMDDLIEDEGEMGEDMDWITIYVSSVSFGIEDEA